MGVSFTTQPRGANAPPDLFSRLMAKVKKDEAGCWLFTGATTNDYGVIQEPDYGKLRRAHVVSFEHFYGPVLDGLEVCHTCNVKICVRPQHLYAGTHAVNMHQAGNDGLLPHGEGHHKAKLTVEQVREIRAAMDGYPPKGKKAGLLADVYGVNRTTIGNIALNINWKGV